MAEDSNLLPMFVATCSIKWWPREYRYNNIYQRLKKKCWLSDVELGILQYNTNGNVDPTKVISK